MSDDNEPVKVDIERVVFALQDHVSQLEATVTRLTDRVTNLEGANRLAQAQLNQYEMEGTGVAADLIRILQVDDKITSVQVDIENDGRSTWKVGRA